MKAKTSKITKARAGGNAKTVSAQSTSFSKRMASSNSPKSTGAFSPTKRATKVSTRSRDSRVRAILDKLVKQFEPALRDLAK